jgi:hypothetical protein
MKYSQLTFNKVYFGFTSKCLPGTLQIIFPVYAESESRKQDLSLILRRLHTTILVANINDDCKNSTRVSWNEFFPYINSNTVYIFGKKYAIQEHY